MNFHMLTFSGSSQPRKKKKMRDFIQRYKKNFNALLEEEVSLLGCRKAK